MSTHPDATRVEQSNEIAGIVIDVHHRLFPREFVTIDLRYGIADALWAAGYRKPEAAPSDTDDLEARIAHRQTGIIMREFARRLAWWEGREGHTTIGIPWLRNHFRLMLARYPLPEGDMYEPFVSQPVQVEVTNDMVERAAKAINLEGWTFQGEHEPGEYCGDCRDVCLPLARAALSAALGGGDRG